MKKILLCLMLLFSMTVGGTLFAAPVNINQATVQELADNLNGVGIKKAQAIVQYRNKIGEFQSKEQLLNVKGIGTATIEKNQGDIQLN